MSCLNGSRGTGRTLSMTSHSASVTKSSLLKCDIGLKAPIITNPHLHQALLDAFKINVVKLTSITLTGRPWHYESMLKNLENDKQCDADDEDTSFEASKGDSDIVNENKIAEHVANVVATSTPEKVTGNSYSGNISNACQIFEVTETMSPVKILVFLEQ